MSEMPRGPAADHVVENMKRLRAGLRWSLAELSEEMSRVGRPILPSGLHRIEQGKRRIDVDDLVALAAALRVPPLALLQGQSESVNGGQTSKADKVALAHRLLDEIAEDR